MLLNDADQTQRENEYANAVLQPCFPSGKLNLILSGDTKKRKKWSIADVQYRLQAIPSQW